MKKVQRITFNKDTKKKESTKATHQYDKRSSSKITPIVITPNRYQETRDRFMVPMTSGEPLLNEKALFTESKKPEDYPIIVDQKTGKKVVAVIKECRWFETGFTKLKESNKIVKESRPIKIKPADLMNCLDTAVNKLRESNPEAFARINKLREAGNNNFDTGDPGVGAYLPLPPNDLQVQQYINTFWQQAAEALWLYDHFGPIRGGMRMLTAFLLGDGCKFKFVDKASQAIWDEFEDRTNFQGKLFDFGVYGLVFGEILFHLPEVIVNGQLGYVRIQSQNPTNCWEKITDVNNLEDIKAYYFNYSTRWLLQTVAGNPMVEYIIEMIPPEEMIHIKFNSGPWEARGRSQIQSALSDSKMLQDYLNARVVKAYQAACMVIDHKIEGDSSDVQAASQQEQSLVGPGAVVTHNDSESYEILQGDAGNDSKSGLHSELLTNIAIGLGLPPTYVGAGEGGSRAAALSQTDPAAKVFNTIRGIFEGEFRNLAKRVLYVAQLRGRLTSDANTKVEIIWPELTSENASGKITMILQAEANGTFDHQTSSELIAKELDNTTYDYAGTQDNIKQQIAANPKLAPLFYVNPSKAPQEAPGGKTTSSNEQGNNQGRSAYGGSGTMSLDGDTKAAVSQSIESLQLEINKLRESLQANKTVPSKQAKRHIGKTLKSRTKAVLFNSEANSGSTSGALTTVQETQDVDADQAVEEAMRLVGQLNPSDIKLESAPPDMDQDIVDKVVDEYGADSPQTYATLWMIRNNYNA